MGCGVRTVAETFPAFPQNKSIFSHSLLTFDLKKLLRVVGQVAIKKDYVTGFNLKQPVLKCIARDHLATWVA